MQAGFEQGKQSVTERLRSLDHTMLSEFDGFCNAFEWSFGTDTERLIPCMSDEASAIVSESLDPRTSGLVVDYMTAYMLDQTMEPRDAFKLARKGSARLVTYDFIYDMGPEYYPRLVGEDVVDSDGVEAAVSTLFERIDRTLSADSLEAAAKLTWFDEFARGSGEKLSLKAPLKEVRVSEATARNLRIMIERAMTWLGPSLDAYELDVGNDPAARLVSSAVVDYVSNGCLWDMKCATNDPGPSARLQVLCYLLMGANLGDEHVAEAERIGIVNPRRDEAVTLAIADIAERDMRLCCEHVIGYPSDVTDSLVAHIVSGEPLEVEHTASDIRRKTYGDAMSRIEKLKKEREQDG